MQYKKLQILTRKNHSNRCHSYNRNKHNAQCRWLFDYSHPSPSIYSWLIIILCTASINNIILIIFFHIIALSSTYTSKLEWRWLPLLGRVIIAVFLLMVRLDPVRPILWLVITIRMGLFRNVWSIYGRFLRIFKLMNLSWVISKFIMNKLMIYWLLTLQAKRNKNKKQILKLSKA